MIKLTTALLLIVVAGACLGQQASLQASFVAPRIPVNLEADQSGLLADMHQLLMAHADIESTMKVLSHARAQRMMEAKAVDAFFPSWLPNHFDVDMLYSSPLMRVEFFIFTASGQPALAQLADLQGKRLGILEAYRLSLPLDDVPGLFVHRAINAQALYNMLASGRVDAIIMSKNEVELVCSLRNLPMLSFDPKAMLDHKYLGYSFLNNAKGVVLQRRVNAAILKLQKSGELVRRFPNFEPYLR
ncbi:transporter substrate-binding domain-containing protein [Simiduia sp. 21SJ11W-1]|uniref:substrate-binding periplasmic protein n=1 Tax=Simiduia sp. 21SJ11W-1 TaxID=2909669 RepID=UPI00209D175B|nr:transporter substrate-binding domain-containing protein [Simiduia sp. 21SJ11W-1]UTA48075.1 transporter substrate-binding domain-containing protein [Simiduia sp. 21SJ11W-1]